MYRMFNDFDMQARAWSVSSCTWFPKRVAKDFSKSTADKLPLYDGRGFFSRSFARLINPLLHDILIAIAEK